MRIFILLFLFLSLSCQKSDFISDCSQVEYFEPQSAAVQYSNNSDLPMLLGERLDNPYTVENMRLAYEELKNEGNVLIPPLTIAPTHYYLCYKPSSIADLNNLEEIRSLELFDFPLDYEIIRYGNYYRKSGLPDSIPTWHYSTVSLSEWEGVLDSLSMYSIPYEVLDSLYLAVPDISLRGMNLDVEDIYSLLEDKSLELTGNLEFSSEGSQNRSQYWVPSGRIMAYDNILQDYVPLENVKVVAYRWFWSSVAYTDSQGYFQCPNSTNKYVKYRIKWESNRWDIRDGTFGQANYNDNQKRYNSWELFIPFDNYKSIRYAVIHRALNRMYYGNNIGVSRPDNFRKEKISYYHKNGSVYGDYSHQLLLGVGPDIRIYGKYNNQFRSLSEIYSTVSHELGHLSHYTNSRNKYINSTNFILESWARCVQYALTYKEYEELNALYLLDPIIGIDLPGGFNQSIPMVEPDSQYNFQNWSSLWEGEAYDYSPLFIDLIDTYNQRLYYISDTSIPDSYNATIPNDDIRNVPISLIEDIVFRSTNITQFKHNLQNELLMLDKPYLVYYNSTIQTINNLFEVYE